MVDTIVYYLKTAQMTNIKATNLLDGVIVGRVTSLARKEYKLSMET